MALKGRFAAQELPVKRIISVLRKENVLPAGSMRTHAARGIAVLMLTTVWMEYVGIVDHLVRHAARVILATVATNASMEIV